MRVFDSYTNRVREAVQKGRQSKSLNGQYLNYTGSTTDILEKSLKTNRSTARMKMQPESSLLSLQLITSVSNTEGASIGRHPDFVDLIDTDQIAYHYITSVFIDIKGSTNLNDTYDLETIYTITNTIQSAAIHVCLMFGGHIQRLQGDGVFAYFGGKKLEKTQAVRNAITAASMFSYFIENDIERIFEGDGVENISTRIGIDFGDDHEVMWGNFGAGGCTELTTLSLHTSLAPKMQSFAKKNGIVVGQNVKDKLQIEEKFFDLVRDSNGNIIQRYIYQGKKKNINYTQYKFEWYDYLKGLPFMKLDKEGNLYLLPPGDHERLSALRNTTSLISSGNAFTNEKGHVSNNPSGIKNQSHRFHHE